MGMGGGGGLNTCGEGCNTCGEGCNTCGEGCNTCGEGCNTCGEGCNTCVISITTVMTGPNVTLCRSPGNIRLSDGATPETGRLETYDGTAWYPVCSSNFKNYAAGLACEELGFQQ
ncbi:hypothetical protein BaRGS_00019257 [Batillaria attramentaria]|uniref:SRCR domain-containing protein n=1 Tax=Batillaria attramentaria TaxID=370345 RepID=A0ABD0KQE4_9CAEN